MRPSVKTIGSEDPHFSFAWLLMCVVWVRAYGTDQMLLPDDPPVDERDLPRPAGSSRSDIEQIKNAMPALFDDPRNPASYLGQQSEWEGGENRPLACRDCRYFNSQRGYCSYRHFFTTAASPFCDFGDPLDDPDPDDY